MKGLLIGIAVAVAAWSGCGDINKNPDTSHLTEEETTAPDEGGTAVLAPCEDEGDKEADPNQFSWGCEVTEPCTTLTLVYDGGASGGEPSEAWSGGENAPLACVLSAFKDGTKGTSVTIEMKEDALLKSWHEQIIFVGNGNALAEGLSVEDSAGARWIKRRQVLKDSSHFDGCLTKAGPKAVFDCIKDWSAGCGATALSCP